MTLPRLLSKIAPTVPRYVTVNGTVVTDGVTATGNGYAHATAGHVTPVQPHRFHHGAIPADEDEEQPWWVTDPQRLRDELAHMATAFPGFTYEDSDGPLWHGELDTGRGRYGIAVVARQSLTVPPAVLPLQPNRLVRKEGRRTRVAPHRYDNGALCLCHLEDWDPSHCDTVTAVAWAAHWFAAFTEWRIGGPWPTDGQVADAA